MALSRRIFPLVSFILILGEFILRKLHSKINFSLSRKQVLEFKKVSESNELLFNQNEMFKICRPASYMVYYLKEVNGYINKLADCDLSRLNETKKLRRELQHLSKEEVFYSKYI